nr:ribosomal protein L20 [Hypnea sp.]
MYKKKNKIITLNNVKAKKRFLNKLLLKKLNYTNIIKYNFFHYFMLKEKLILNKKILLFFISTENGSMFSLKKWFNFFIFRYY